MKKLLIIILIGGGIFVYLNRDEYVPKINQQIDIFVPEEIQNITADLWSQTLVFWESTSSSVDVYRENFKLWSINESISLVETISAQEIIPATKSFSPILDNSSVVFSSSSSLVQKLYGALLFSITLLFWNFKILMVWIAILLWYSLKAIRQKYFPKRRKSFFDKIQEKVVREEDDWD